VLLSRGTPPISHPLALSHAACRIAASIHYACLLPTQLSSAPSCLVHVGWYDMQLHSPRRENMRHGTDRHSPHSLLALLGHTTNKCSNEAPRLVEASLLGPPIFTCLGAAALKCTSVCEMGVLFHIQVVNSLVPALSCS
jgi:hypothetical protein